MLIGTKTLLEAREELAQARHEGVTCPCCDQLAKVYRRKITQTGVRALVDLYRAVGTEFCHAPSLIGGRAGGEFARLRYWGLIEPSLRVGFWRVTDAGERFLKGASTVRQYVLIYNAQMLAFEGRYITIHNAAKFDLGDLMAGI